MTNPLEPTDHVPGSPGKLLVLAARYEAGAELWMRGDRPNYEGMYPDVATVEEFNECEP